MVTAPRLKSHARVPGGDTMRVHCSHAQVAFEWVNAATATGSFGTGASATGTGAGISGTGTAAASAATGIESEGRLAALLQRKELAFRVACDAFPDVLRFYLLFFADDFQCQLHACWQVVITPYPRYGIVCTFHTELVVFFTHDLWLVLNLLFFASRVLILTRLIP
jgi:hypothetical protein